MTRRIKLDVVDGNRCIEWTDHRAIFEFDNKEETFNIEIQRKTGHGRWEKLPVSVETEDGTGNALGQLLLDTYIMYDMASRAIGSMMRDIQEDIARTAVDDIDADDKPN